MQHVDECTSLYSYICMSFAWWVFRRWRIGGLAVTCTGHGWAERRDSWHCTWMVWAAVPTSGLYICIYTALGMQCHGMMSSVQFLRCLQWGAWRCRDASHVQRGLPHIRGPIWEVNLCCQASGLTCPGSSLRGDSHSVSSLT